eukprot:gnl/MRDRNA2_/MRDRNA2_29734_c0_seq1.p1 gnl/MRDRNA2_/MRDRNA2_29734_c0~~gnl/MRDRNA2_/MRDRNA2_29734_c0_seq1.p1  ORF type:complete len:230 (-),score=23.64 gnl/MRDRNA2_/MRDRNA2_29734_c0_seq1:41-634(-)
MESADLKQLAAEREARAKARTGEMPSYTPMPNAWQGSKAQSTSSGAVSFKELARVHRSIRLAHSLGLILLFFGLLLMLFMSNRYWGLCIIFGGIVLARTGGQFIHSMLPPLLHEGNAPTSQEMSAGSCSGLFCLSGIMDPASSFAIEWATLLENLAFICTYGKRNCLTSEMYAGEITFGKIFSLVYGKLSSGVVKCN